MKILLSLAIIAASYYSFSYGIYLWKIEKNTLAGFGVLLITLTGMIAPIIVLFLRG